MDNYTLNDYTEMVLDYILFVYRDDFPLDDYVSKEAFEDCLEEEIYNCDGTDYIYREVFSEPKNELERKINEWKNVEKVIGEWRNKTLREAIDIVVGNNIVEKYDNDGSCILCWV